MGVRLTWTDCDEAGDYVVPHNDIYISPRDLVSRPDNMDETVLHYIQFFNIATFNLSLRENKGV